MEALIRILVRIPCALRITSVLHGLDSTRRLRFWSTVHPGLHDILAEDLFRCTFILQNSPIPPNLGTGETGDIL